MRRQNLILKLDESYEAVDPFKPSVAFSLKNLFGKRVQHQAGEGDENDLTSLPTRRRVDGRGRIPGRYDAGNSGPHRQLKLCMLPPQMPATPVTMHSPVIPDTDPQLPYPHEFSHIRQQKQHLSGPRLSQDSRGRPSDSPDPPGPAWRVRRSAKCKRRHFDRSCSSSPDHRSFSPQPHLRHPELTQVNQQIHGPNTTKGQSSQPVLVPGNQDDRPPEGGHTPRGRSSTSSQLSYDGSRSGSISTSSSLSQIDLASPLQDIGTDPIATPQRSPSRSRPGVIPPPSSRWNSPSLPQSRRSNRRSEGTIGHRRLARSPRRRSRTRSRSRLRTLPVHPVIIRPPAPFPSSWVNNFPPRHPTGISVINSYNTKPPIDLVDNTRINQHSSDSLNAKDTTKRLPLSETKKEESKESFLSQTWPYLLAFTIDTMPRQIYLHFLLRLPYLYFTRVSRIFEEAEMSISEIKQGILETAQKQKDLAAKMATARVFDPPVVNEPYQNLNKTWTDFIDTLLKEWKTLNIISVLLLTAILTILQLDGAGTDPLTRFTALISMICALMSLLFGGMYIIRFGTMRKTYKAAEWACEAKRTRTGIFWNVWVMLAMPAAWLAWSMVSYIVCVMSFVWRTGTLSDTNRKPFSDDVALVPRIVVTVVLALGLIYFSLITLTLRQYGALMDRAWQRRIQGWIFELEAPLSQKSNNPSTSKVPINTFGMPTSYPEEKIAAYKADEEINPASQFGPVYPVERPPSAHSSLQHSSISVPKREMKSAMGPGSKNCGIHWDSKAKVGSSVVSLDPESEIKPTSGVDSAFSTLFAGSTNLYAPVRLPAPTSQKEKTARSTSPGANHQGNIDDDSCRIVCHYPGTPGAPNAGSSVEGVDLAASPPFPPFSKPLTTQELSYATICHVSDREKGVVKLAKKAQEKEPLIRVMRLFGLSDSDPPFSIPPTEHDLEQCGLKIDPWKESHKDAHKNWKLNPESEAMNKDHAIHGFIAHWNETHSAWSQHQIRLCEERSGASSSGSFAIYHFNSSEDLPYDDTRYDVSGLDIQRVDVLGPFEKVRDDDVELRRLSLFATHLYIGDALLRENVLEKVDTKGAEKPEPEVTSPALVAEESDEPDD